VEGVWWSRFVEHGVLLLAHKSGGRGRGGVCGEGTAFHVAEVRGNGEGEKRVEREGPS
jgi:hypothetical protein